MAGEKTDPLPGSTLADRYRVNRRIGEGGMGVVYEATHVVIGRTVALKVLHERYVDRPEAAARLMNEARLASSIHNQHIVDIFDFGETSDGRTFVVMELCAGESLAQVIRRDGALDERRVARVGVQVADALGAAHAAGVIHRDVKPENVFLLQRDGTDFVKVLDFGISKAVVPAGEDATTPRLTHTGVVLGTPLYMSPEQARGDETIDHRIDVHALGVILYESLTGAVPYSGTNYLNIIAEVQHRQAVPPRALRPDLGISAAMEQVVLRAMHKDRDLRHPSMEALGADLRRVLAGEPIAPLAPVADAATTPRTKPDRRRGARAGLWTAGALAVLCLAGASIYLARASRSPSRSDSLGAVVEPAPLPPPSASSSHVAATPTTPPAKPSPERPPPASPTVIVKIQSTPSGATILNGARKLGVTPQDVELARSDHPVHLRFERDGYEPSATDVVPQIDGEAIEIELKPSPPPVPPPPHAHAHRPQPRPRPPVVPEMLPAPHPYD